MIREGYAKHSHRAVEEREEVLARGWSASWAARARQACRRRSSPSDTLRYSDPMSSTFIGELDHIAEEKTIKLCGIDRC